MLYALCGISGSGKTALLEATLRRLPHLARLTTCTTRSPRVGELDGWDYHFVEEAAFQDRLAQGLLVCPINYRGSWYATALADLRLCAQRDALAVLRPDKLGALATYAPLYGIYLERGGHALPDTADDRIICAHQQCCRSHLVNVPGQLDQTVLALVRLIEHEQHTQKETQDGENAIFNAGDSPGAPAAFLR